MRQKKNTLRFTKRFLAFLSKIDEENKIFKQQLRPLQEEKHKAELQATFAETKLGSNKNNP